MTPDLLANLVTSLSILIVLLVMRANKRNERTHEKRIRQILSHSPAIEAAFDEQIEREAKAKKRWLPERREWRRA